MSRKRSEGLGGREQGSDGQGWVNVGMDGRNEAEVY